MADPFNATASYSGGAGGAAGPSTSRGENFFDSSGWNVNFGGGSISTADKLGAYIPWIVAGVGALVLWKMYRKR